MEDKRKNSIHLGNIIFMAMVVVSVIGIISLFVVAAWNHI